MERIITRRIEYDEECGIAQGSKEAFQKYYTNHL
jgi:hypothetical protein